MEPGRTNLTEAVRSVQLLNIDGYRATSTLNNSEYIKSSWNVDGHDWEVHFYPKYVIFPDYEDIPFPFEDEYFENWVVVKLILASDPLGKKQLRANLCCRLEDPSGDRDLSEEKSVSHVFGSRKECSSKLLLLKTDDVASSGYLINDSLTVQCTITVLKEMPGIVTPAATEAALPLLFSDLQLHLGELLRGQWGADVTFVLDSGEHLPAHKGILAARSPVFMAEFFGHMNERVSQCVRIEDMDAAVFKAMLHFIYTNTAPELDEEYSEPAKTMAQHLLAAADRYGLDGLKLICEGKLSVGIDVDTVATTLALAEQHKCSLLRSKCIDFIASSSETLDAVLVTDGYKHLVESCPLVLTELLRAARGWRS